MTLFFGFSLRIWNHLIDISSRNHTTVIITTHYIEEATKANSVGLMRAGRILAEASPSQLLSSYSEPTLENVFLKLCVSDEQSSARGATQKKEQEEERESEGEELNEKWLALKRVIVRIPGQVHENSTKAFGMPKFKNYLGILYKEYVVCRASLLFTLFQLLFPALTISLVCLFFGHEPSNLRFGIANNETLLNVTANSEGSELFVNELSNLTFEKLFLNVSEAYHLTREGLLWGYIDLGAFFSQQTIEKFSSNEPSNKTIAEANVNVYLDTTS